MHLRFYFSEDCTGLVTLQEGDPVVSVPEIPGMRVALGCKGGLQVA